MTERASPHIRRRVLWQPKADRSAEEYEDAAFASQETDLPLRAAVADGATESAFSGIWANHLVRRFTAEGTTEPAPFRERLRQWQANCQEIIEQRTPTSWYAQAKAAEGAFAAFLGFVLQPGGTWRALAVGDCCLFHVRDAEVIEQWPVEDASDFTNHPALLSSRPEHDVPALLEQDGRWQGGDAFVLATDALAAWIMTEPAGLLALGPEGFEESVEAARSAGVLRNDDVTALVLEIETDNASH